MAEKMCSQSAGQLARLLAQNAVHGALATIRRGKGDKSGHPYVSKVGTYLDIDGSPLFLFSTLAAHTQDLLADCRASILFEAPETTANPLDSARATLVGTIERLESGQDERERARYIKVHPSAVQYADFGDFSVWRMSVEKVQYVGGFGLAKWVKAMDYIVLCDD